MTISLKALFAALPAAMLVGATAAYAVPINDDIDGSILLTGTGSYIQDVTGATASGAPAGNYGGIDNDVWFTFFGTGANAEVSTSNPATDYDTQIWVYSGYDGFNLSSLSVVDYDDDGGSGFSSLVNFATTSGTQYWFNIDGFAGDSGTFELSYADLADAAPVPLPASGLLLGGLLLGGGVAARRKKRT
ncbi:hypothetical protein [Gymnodinialimonas sp. 57CJ19]|uniref:hypothetical protein n=1 Tax=Gymnodinialimonas sp. 57CJ19 TaxID=3138498 RepID=UPI00313435BB